MYTLSMQTNSPSKSLKAAMHFTQEHESWEPSSSDHADEGSEANRLGLWFQSPLEGLSITFHQLGALIAGLDTAYASFIPHAVEEIEGILGSTVYRSMDGYLVCTTVLGQPGQPCPPEWDSADMTAYPYLYDEANGRSLVYRAKRWGFVESCPEGEYLSAGTCFGYDVVVPGDADAKVELDPAELAHMVAALMEIVVPVETVDERLHYAHVLEMSK